MLIITRTIVTKEDFIKALAYHFFKERGDMSTLTKNKAKEILRTDIWWTGKCGWTGDGKSSTEVLGEFEVHDDYMIEWEKAKKFIEKNYPKFK